MAALRVIIVDDEPLALRGLERAVERLADVEVVGSAPHGEAGLALVRATAPDVVLLDIKMPEMDGLTLAQILSSGAAPVVIFVTAFDHFALEAFGVAAADYLLKPVDPLRLAEAIERARLRVGQSSAEARATDLQRLVEAMRAEAAPAAVGAAIWVTGPRGRRRLPLGDIDWFEAQRDYVRIHAGGQSYIQRGTLRDLSGKLESGDFQRVHRSAIVNLNAITGIERRNWGLFAVTLKSGAEIPVGRSYLPALRDRVERAGIIQIRG